MEIKTLRVYNLVDYKGAKLQLEFGVITKGLREEHPLNNADKGYRWRFIGTKIPMPVRSGYWFNGFPEPTMLNWLKTNGWALHTCVDPITHKATVYDLPKATEYGEADPKANDWVPVSTGQYPKDGEVVNVTYLDYYDNKPMCDDLAYREEGKWFWYDGYEVTVKITAWKPIGEPYREEN